MAMLPGLHGLYVDFGRTAEGWQVREPSAEFTCAHGCALYAEGAPAVTALCRDLVARHSAVCPAPPSTATHHRKPRDHSR